jgi:hypothetical protein
MVKNARDQTLLVASIAEEKESKGQPHCQQHMQASQESNFFVDICASDNSGHARTSAARAYDSANV